VKNCNAFSSRHACQRCQEITKKRDKFNDNTDAEIHITLSTSIYDLVLLDVCYFHHLQLTFGNLSTIEILVLTSWILHPRILIMSTLKNQHNYGFKIDSM